MRTFLQSAALGTLKRGSHESDVNAALLVPEQTATFPERVRILKYGSVQVALSGDVVERISLRVQARQDPWPWRTIEWIGWCPAEHPARDDVESYLGEIGMGWRPDNALSTAYFSAIRLDSGVLLVYDEHGRLDYVSNELPRP
jgi:hypothetical protein